MKWIEDTWAPTPPSLWFHMLKITVSFDNIAQSVQWKKFLVHHSWCFLLSVLYIQTNARPSLDCFVNCEITEVCKMVNSSQCLLLELHNKWSSWLWFASLTRPCRETKIKLKNKFSFKLLLLAWMINHFRRTLYHAAEGSFYVALISAAWHGLFTWLEKQKCICSADGFQRVC